ncbi:hypothetical protein BGZ60DRAFT_535178 [Tricladium varicosporioides]|nr:hypothetical protein BGZ60DRAFT_535178 [Hymenoscyphus varicosporioides]
MKLTRGVGGVEGRRLRVRAAKREALRELKRQDGSSPTTSADDPSATNSGSGGGDSEGDDESNPNKPKPGPGGGKPGPPGPPGPPPGPPGPAQAQSTTTIQTQTTPPPVASPTTIFTTVTSSSTPQPPPSTSQAAQTSFVTNSITSQVTLASSSTAAQSTTTPRAISTTPIPIPQTAISTSLPIQVSSFSIFTLPTNNPTTLLTSSTTSTTLPPTTPDSSQTSQSATTVADVAPTDPSADHKGIASSLTPGGNALLGIGIAGAISGILLALFIFARRRKTLNKAGRFTMAEAPARVREAYEGGGNTGPSAGPGAGGIRKIMGRTPEGRFEHEVRVDIPQDMNGHSQALTQTGPSYIMAPPTMGGPPSIEAPAVPEKNYYDGGPSTLNQNQYGGKRTLHNPITRKALPIVSITSSRGTDDVDSDGEELMKPEKVPEAAPPARDGRVRSVFGGTPKLRDSASWVRDQTRRRSEF